MTDQPAPAQYSLYVIALSKQVELAALAQSIADALGPVQMIEFVSVPPVTTVPTPPPWWHALQPGARVIVTVDGAPVMGADGRPAQFNSKPLVRNTGAALDVARTPTDDDRMKNRVMVYPDKPPFPGGLFIGADQIKAG